ncbi:hypothetical protein F2Q68_00033915 [Brassica cretica]|uniref:Uncharacterized protein n=1 Tax=Brassica cretica TaxID=69181 RepID=A0A8S9H678_BRACR|nr:hypothetical protein F2Q68_00033915 [Brassica cretica]
MRWFTMLLLMCLASLSQTQTLLKYTEIPVMGVDYGCKVLSCRLVMGFSRRCDCRFSDRVYDINASKFTILGRKCYRRPQKKKEVRENPISRHDDLARSYKGVVINGATDQQGQGRENTDYTGKGKEKMYEEHESKWVKVPEKGGNRYHSYRTIHRGDNGGLRHRSSRFDRSRGYNAEENPRFPREVRRGMSPRVGAAVEAREEGEIPQQEKRQTTRNDQEKTRESVVDPTIILTTVQKVTLESQNVENGLDVINDLLEEGNNEVVDDNMVLDENQSNVLGIVEGSDDGFLNLSDGEVEKKTVVRKGLFKQTAVAGASSKARNIQAIISTRKRATNNTKPATRQGEGAKHHEEKGPSNPKPTSSKS